MSGHLPVLSQELIELLEPGPGAVAIDGTVGGGGHATALLQRILPGGRLLGIDRDPAAITRAAERLRPFGDAVLLRHADFAEMDKVAAESGLASADAVVFDLGFSSDQIEDPARGMSFRLDGPLDMRLDPTSGMTAAELVNRSSQLELTRIIRELGEERWASRIAQYIVARRPLRATRELAGAVEAAIPRRAWPRDIHPATRTFQALRIAVNDELGSLERGLAAALTVLSPGGRLATISFHSLEDRIVKSFLNLESRDCICPPAQPVCTCGHQATLRILTRRPVRPGQAELAGNPRARSARLRAAQKL